MTINVTTQEIAEAIQIAETMQDLTTDRQLDVLAELDFSEVLASLEKELKVDEILNRR
jgi:hypothetical protein